MDIPAPLISQIASLAAYRDRTYSRARYVSESVEVSGFRPIDLQDVTSFVAASLLQDEDELIDSSSLSASLNMPSCFWVLELRNETKSRSSLRL